MILSFSKIGIPQKSSMSFINVVYKPSMFIHFWGTLPFQESSIAIGASPGASEPLRHRRGHPRGRAATFWRVMSLIYLWRVNKVVKPIKT